MSDNSTQMSFRIEVGERRFGRINWLGLQTLAGREIKRFLVGPKECEITGFAFSPDRRTAFIGVQHPGERGDSHWPDGGDTVPRSAVIAIARDDNAVIG